MNLILLPIMSGSVMDICLNPGQSEAVTVGMSLGIIGKEKPLSPGFEISSMYCSHCSVAESPFANSSGGS